MTKITGKSTSRESKQKQKSRGDGNRPISAVPGSAAMEVPPKEMRDAPPYCRPWSALSALPLGLRWEVTRRHGYYISCWEALKFQEVSRQRPLTEKERAAFSLAQAILGCIGYSGPAIAPSTPVESLDANPFDSTIQGAILPLSLRGLFRLLLVHLNYLEQNHIGSFFRGMSDPEEIGESQIGHALRIATSPQLAWLDRMPFGLHVTIDLHAPLEAILEEVKTAVKDQKQRMGIRETRRRHSEIPKYLEVWDRREGWHEGAYHGSRESTLKQIAQELGRPLSTIASQYRAGFEAITGRPYDSYIWLRIFGVLKLCEIFGCDELPNRSVDRMVSAIKAEEDEAQVFDGSPSAIEDQLPDSDIIVLVEQIQQMLKQGLPTDDIQEHLCLKSDQLIEYFRKRQSDNI